MSKKCFKKAFLKLRDSQELLEKKQFTGFFFSYPKPK